MVMNMVSRSLADAMNSIPNDDSMTKIVASTTTILKNTANGSSTNVCLNSAPWMPDAHIHTRLARIPHNPTTVVHARLFLPTLGKVKSMKRTTKIKPVSKSSGSIKMRSANEMARLNSILSPASDRCRRHCPGSRVDLLQNRLHARADHMDELAGEQPEVHAAENHDQERHAIDPARVARVRPLGMHVAQEQADEHAQEIRQRDGDADHGDHDLNRILLPAPRQNHQFPDEVHRPRQPHRGHQCHNEQIGRASCRERV